MNASVAAANLGAWWLQAALLLGAGLLIPTLLRIREPRARLALAHALLASAVALPLLQRLRSAPLPAEIPVFRLDLLVGPGGPVAAASGPSAWAGLLGTLALVALVRLAFLAAGLLSLKRLRSRAVPLDPEPPSVEEARRLTGVEAPVLASEEVDVPLTQGGLRPAVLLPPSFARLSASAQRAILCHELLHVRRRDTLAVLGEEALGALLWFHPAVRAVLSRVGLWREQAVDAEVVRLTRDRRAYLQALSDFAHATAPSAAASLPFHRPGHLVRRMALLTKELPMSRNRWLTALVGSLALALVLGTGALAVRSFPLAAAAAAAGATTAADDSVYKVGGEVKEPVLTSKIQPAYPEEARKNRVQGEVILEAVIDQKGTVTSVVVLKSPDELLSNAAAEAVRKWTYKPATKGGKPVKVLMTVTVAFRLA